MAASSTIKQYNKWLEKTSKSGDEDERQKVGGGGGIIGSIKKALSGKDDEVRETQVVPIIINFIITRGLLLLHRIFMKR